jgi:hypothetical protein
MFSESGSQCRGDQFIFSGACQLLSLIDEQKKRLFRDQLANELFDTQGHIGCLLFWIREFYFQLALEAAQVAFRFHLLDGQPSPSFLCEGFGFECFFQTPNQGCAGAQTGLPQVRIGNQEARLFGSRRQVLPQKDSFSGTARSKDGREYDGARLKQGEIALREFRARAVPDLIELHYE